MSGSCFSSIHGVLREKVRLARGFKTYGEIENMGFGVSLEL
jgi:hypothetical protein